MLRIAHPPPGGNGTDPPRRRPRGPSASLSLTRDEAQHFRVACRNAARVHFGTLSKLAAAIDVPPQTLSQALSRRRLPSVALAFRIARAAKTPLEAMLYPALATAGTCPTCGARKVGAP